MLPAAVDAQIEIERDGVAKVSTATLVKSRDGETGEMFSFELAVVKLGQDDDGDVITSCVVEVTDRKPAKSAKKTNAKQRRALDVLNNVLADHGKPAPDPKHYPAGATVVDVSLWRESLFKADVLDKTASNPRENYRRLKDQLAGLGLIGDWNDLMWAVQPNQTDGE